MRALEYSVVRLYFGEAKKALHQGLYVSCIAVSGMLAELMARELRARQNFFSKLELYTKCKCTHTTSRYLRELQFVKKSSSYTYIYWSRSKLWL